MSVGVRECVGVSVVSEGACRGVSGSEGVCRGVSGE